MVSTNMLGTRTVLAAAADTGVPQVVCASTGKALRPFSPICTPRPSAPGSGSRPVATSSDMPVSASRFTHVLDNSIIYKRLLTWADGTGDGVIRLHNPDIAFYVQSALESAQLLQWRASAASRESSLFTPSAISAAGQPHGPHARRGGALGLADAYLPQRDDRGYEEIPFPGLYDRRDVSPL